MADKPNVAEEAGMSFEIRCEQAKSSLQRLWTLFQNMSVEDLEQKEARVQRKNKFLATLSDPTRIGIEALLKDLDIGRDNLDEQFYKMMWENGLRWTREIYGNDAADFALRATERERAGN